MAKVRISRWIGGKMVTLDDIVAEEAFLHLEIDSTAIDTLISPGQVKEFVYGNLFSEGFIAAPSDVRRYSSRKRGNEIFVKTSITDFEKKESKLRRNYRVIWTDCVTEPTMAKRMGEKISASRPSKKVEPDVLSGISLLAAKSSDLYQETGAYHYSYLFDLDGGLIVSTWDISRHNTVDKVVGHVLLSGGDFRDTILFTTGRLTSTLVMKVLRCGIPVVASKGAPLKMAVDMARDHDLAVVGFLRRGRFNIYSGLSHFGGN